jgi:hypothetical protein
MPPILKIEPALIGSTVAALYAAVAMLYRAFIAHEGVFDLDIAVAAVTAVWGLYTRMRVTPLARPRDAGGKALQPQADAVQT